VTPEPGTDLNGRGGHEAPKPRRVGWSRESPARLAGIETLKGRRGVACAPERKPRRGGTVKAGPLP
jgi:hypothetical protein